MKTQIFYSHGKLLITGEYAVLDNAIALAVPTQKGQYLSVKPIDGNQIIWRSFDENHKIWLEFIFDSQIKKINCDTIEAETLLNILKTAQKLNPSFLDTKQGYLITTHLTFNQQYGLGSSSTLINNIAKWAKVNPFELLRHSFGGSGYDIACADSNNALTYQIQSNKPTVNPVEFNPPFSENIYFIHLNQKQDSKLGIQQYKTLNPNLKHVEIEKINNLTNEIMNCTNINRFNVLINLHEHIISKLIQTPRIKETHFKDYKKGSIKSLGAWGGDFIMVTTEEESDLDYFRSKGYQTIYSFKDMLI